MVPANTDCSSIKHDYGEFGLDVINTLAAKVETQEHVVCTIHYNKESKLFSLVPEGAVSFNKERIQAIFLEMKSCIFRPKLLRIEPKAGPLLFFLQ